MSLDAPLWDETELTFNPREAPQAVRKVGSAFHTLQPTVPLIQRTAITAMGSVVLTSFCFAALLKLQLFGIPALGCAALTLFGPTILIIVLDGRAQTVRATRKGLEVWGRRFLRVEDIAGVKLARVRSAPFYSNEREWVVVSLRDESHLAIRVDHEVMGRAIVAKLEFLFAQNQGTVADVPKSMAALQDESSADR